MINSIQHFEEIGRATSYLLDSAQEAWEELLKAMKTGTKKELPESGKMPI